jgi:putative phosphoesterase
MKIAVFSDSHRNTVNINLALNLLNGHIDLIVHCGDGWDEAHELAAAWKIPLQSVGGNCDFSYDSTIKTFHCGGKKFLVTHGHNYYVKSGHIRISRLAEENEADVCLFGHTHIPRIFYIGKTTFMNPGSISLPKDKHPCTYGIITVADNGIIEASIIGLKNGHFSPIKV